MASFLRFLPWALLAALAPPSCAVRRTQILDVLEANGSNASLARRPIMLNLPHPALTGDCAIHDADNWKPATDDTCYVYVYRCSNSRHEKMVNHNVGDVGWALSGECHEYGTYLHIAKIEFARVWMYAQPCWDDGVLKLCNGGYTMCNRGPWGSACGCGINGDECGPEPDRNRASANNFGWRRVPDYLFKNIPWDHQDLGTCPCNQYALPKRAMGPVDASLTGRFLDEAIYEDRWQDAGYQWNQVGRERVVSIDSCLRRHVLRDEWSTAEKVAAFKTAVLDRKEHDCRH